MHIQINFSYLYKTDYKTTYLIKIDCDWSTLRTDGKSNMHLVTALFPQSECYKLQKNTN